MKKLLAILAMAFAFGASADGLTLDEIAGEYRGTIVDSEYEGYWEVYNGTVTLTLSADGKFRAKAVFDDGDVCPFASSTSEITSVKDGIVTIKGSFADDFWFDYTIGINLATRTMAFWAKERDGGYYASTLTITATATSQQYKPWTLDNSAAMPGGFWTITSPDKKWQLACVPSNNNNVQGGWIQGESDIVITSHYHSGNRGYYIDDFTGKDTALLKGSGVLTLPARAVDTDGKMYTISINDWSFEERETQWKTISKIIIPGIFTTYVGDAFNCCGQFEVSAANPRYYAQDGVLFMRGGEDGDVLLAMPCGKTGSYRIPDGVTHVQSGAFEYCRLSSLTIGQDLEAFYQDHEVGAALKNIIIEGNDSFRYENGFLMQDWGGYADLIMTLWGVVNGKDVLVPSYVGQVMPYACAYGDYDKLKGANSITFTSDALYVCEHAFEGAATSCIDFSRVGSLELANHNIFGEDTMVKTIKFPEDTTFANNSFSVYGHESKSLDIYWPTSKGRAASGLNNLYVESDGTVTLHVLNSAGDWPKTLGNVPVAKDLYSVSLDLNYGDDPVAGPERYVAYNQAVGELPEPGRTGHQFLGWFTAREGGVKVTASTKVVDDVIYYAHWQYDGSAIVSASVAPECEGMGSVTGGGSVVKAGAKVTLKATANDGYAFEGWYKGGELIPDAAATYTYIATGEEAVIVAHFAPITVACPGLSNGTFVVGIAGDSSGIPVTVSPASGVKSVAVAKLPAGMKYDAKTGLITGAPTKPGSYEVTVTVTTTSGSKKIETFVVDVATLPESATGTFNGFVHSDHEGEDIIGTFQLTAADAGKLTAKVTTAAGAYSFTGNNWDSVLAGAYNVTLLSKNGDELRLSLDSSAGWNETQLRGIFTPAGKSKVYVSARRNAFGSSWNFSATPNGNGGWTLGYAADAKTADLKVTLKADGTTTLAGSLGGTSVSASGYADVTGLADGVIYADFAPVATLKANGKSEKRVISVRTRLWFNRSDNHPGAAGSAKIIE